MYTDHLAIIHVHSERLKNNWDNKVWDVPVYRILWKNLDDKERRVAYGKTIYIMGESKFVTLPDHPVSPTFKRAICYILANPADVEIDGEPLWSLSDNGNFVWESSED